MGYLLEEVRRKISNYQARSCYKRMVNASSEPMVTFTFDDFPRSAYRQAGPILQGYGGHGTYYVSMGLMSQTTRCGELFGLDDLRQLVREGHELACHTRDHLECSQISSRVYEQNVVMNIQQAAQMLNGYTLRHFAYPCGSVTGPHKKVLARHFRTLRTIESGINTGRFDLNRLRGNRLYSRSVPVEIVLRLIEDNVRLCGWLIFYTHDVCESPSPFGCSPSYLAEVVKQAVRSGARILTVDQAASCLV